MPVPADTPTEAKERLALMKLMDEGDYKVPTRKVDVNFMLATWNIQQFSEKKEWRALKYIADIIERFDLVALQEVKTDLRGIAKLQEILPGDYRCLLSDATGNYERFVYIYDRRTIRPTGLASDLGLNLDTQTHAGFQIHRMPYCASFKIGRFDFTVVSAHIFQSDTTFREREIDILAENIAKMSEREASKVVDRDFFVVGDFNIDKAGDRFFEALVNHEFEMPEELDHLTTNFGRTKTFDKIAWVKRPDFKFSGRCNVVPFYKAVYQDENPKGGESKISDHLPLWAEFEINELTLQLSQIINKD